MSAEHLQDRKEQITSTVATLLGYGPGSLAQATEELKTLNFAELSRTERIIVYAGWQAVFGEKAPQEVNGFIDTLKGAEDLTEEETGWLITASTARAFGGDCG